MPVTPAHQRGASRVVCVWPVPTSVTKVTTSLNSTPKGQLLGLNLSLNHNSAACSPHPTSHTHTRVDSGNTLTVYQVNSEGSDHV